MKSFTFFCFILLGSISSGWSQSLVVCTESNPDGFDVVRYNSIVTTNASADVLFSRLVELDGQTSKIVPGLAQSWAISPGGLEYTFYLRKGVTFHTTHYFKARRAFNAEDVVFSFERIINPYHPWHKTSPSGYPHAQSMQLSKLIQRIQKIDDYTVKFTLNYPEATFLNKLTMGFASIYSAEYADQLLAKHKTNWLNTKPIGTGPFMLDRYQKDVAIRFSRHPHYFGTLPKIDKLIYAITPDAAVRMQRLKVGECQIMLSPKPLDVIRARRDPTVKVLETPGFMTAFVALNTQRPPLNNALVRQAIRLSFDKEAYIKVIFGGSAIVASQPFPPTTWSWNNTLPVHNYDPLKAKQLLVKAGFPNGFDTTIWVRETGSILNPNPRIGSELLQMDLAKIGIRAQIKILEWGELIRRAKMGEHDLLFMGWAGDSGDPDDFLTPLFTCAAVSSGTNFSRYCNQGLDHLISEGLRTMDMASRTNHYLSAQSIIFDQALWLPIAHPMVSALTKRSILSYHVTPFGRQNFTTLMYH